MSYLSAAAAAVYTTPDVSNDAAPSAVAAAPPAEHPGRTKAMYLFGTILLDSSPAADKVVGRKRGRGMPATAQALVNYYLLRQPTTGKRV